MIEICGCVLVSVVPCKGGVEPRLYCEENPVLDPEGLGCIVQHSTVGSSTWPCL